MITIAETQEYFNHSKKLLNENEHRNIIDYLSAHPRAGDLISGTGGIRKLRWRRHDKGKSGGVRIIYYYYNDEMPLYLLTLFNKGQKVDLNKAERNELAQLVDILKNYWLE